MDSVLSVLKQRLPRRRRRAYGSFSNRQKSQKSVTLTILWNLENPVKIYHGIIGLQHLIGLRRMALLSEQYEEQKKEHQVHCYCQNWMRWSDSLECYCYLQNVQDLLADGKTPYERRFGEPFKGPIIPF